jgi:hypothetical protein
MFASHYGNDVVEAGRVQHQSSSTPIWGRRCVQLAALNVRQPGAMTIRRLMTSDESHPKVGRNGSSPSDALRVSLACITAAAPRALVIRSLTCPPKKGDTVHRQVLTRTVHGHNRERK